MIEVFRLLWFCNPLFERGKECEFLLSLAGLFSGCAKGFLMRQQMLMLHPRPCAARSSWAFTKSSARSGKDVFLERLLLDLPLNGSEVCEIF